MIQTYRQPTAPDFVGLLSLDFGSIYSADGREHPVTAMTPVFVNDPAATPAVTDPATQALIGPAGLSISSIVPQHGWARLVVAVIAIALIIIVALRITL